MPRIRLGKSATVLHRVIPSGHSAAADSQPAVAVAAGLQPAVADVAGAQPAVAAAAPPNPNFTVSLFNGPALTVSMAAIQASEPKIIHLEKETRLEFVCRTTTSQAISLHVHFDPATGTGISGSVVFHGIPCGSTPAALVPVLLSHPKSREIYGRTVRSAGAWRAGPPESKAPPAPAKK